MKCYGCFNCPKDGIVRLLLAVVSSAGWPVFLERGVELACGYDASHERARQTVGEKPSHSACNDGKRFHQAEDGSAIRIS